MEHELETNPDPPTDTQSSLKSLVEFNTLARQSGTVLASWRGAWSGEQPLVHIHGEETACKAVLLDHITLPKHECDLLVSIPMNSAWPVIIGVVAHAAIKNSDEKVENIDMDAAKLVFAAEREVLIRCGKASIQLTSDGKVRIKGTDLLSRSSGGNRIKGGHVNIN